ncbi:MAG: medium chain dehydrogenase/reductase family protein [Acidimicrobiia bacterium]|nr:medium chain dehydrogenase/reductase family protein [Acidimicrobiia bacterium]MDH5237901.1 medium chain dehydrogenase/reductase family protein [Acidimicrobiia bacterium]
MSAVRPVQHEARALVLTGSRRLEERRLAWPPPASDTGLLRVEACGLCGTDHEQYTGVIAAPFAFIPGHEIIGTVERLGDRARSRWNVEVGDRVAVEVFQSCGRCAACVRGEYRRCSVHGMATMYGFVDVEHGSGLWGGYATHLDLGPDALVLPVPDTLDPVMATLFNPVGAGVRWGATLAGTAPGDVVAVLGPGIRGLAVAAAAKDAGADFVMVTGVGPRDAARLAVAARFGADLTVDVSVDDPRRRLLEATGTLASVVVDVTAKAPSAFAQAVSLAGTGARVVVAGTRGSGGAPGFEPDHLVYKELTVIGSLGVDAPAYRRALELLAADRWPFDQLDRRVVGLDGLDGLLRSMAGDEGAEVPPIHGVVVPTR